MPEKSFLASVKDDLGDVFAGVYDQLNEHTTNREVLGDQLKAAHRKVWDIVEKRLKESYRNGQKAGPGSKKDNGKPPAAHDAPESPRSNPFRK